MANERASRGAASPPKRTYRLEMDGWVLQGLIGLMAVTGVAVFYLGYLTGKGVRGPAAPLLISSATQTPPALEQNLLKPRQLSINKALSATPSQKRLEKVTPAGEKFDNTEKLLLQAQKILAKRQISNAQPNKTKNAVSKAPAAKKTTAPPSAVKQAAAPAAQPPRVAVPAKPNPKQPLQAGKALIKPGSAVPPVAQSKAKPPAKKARVAQKKRGTYTVQVFSSTNREHAQNLAKRLKNMKYAVYLNQFQSAEAKVWHRVRVGRLKTRAAANALSKDILKRTGLKQLRVLEQDPRL